ncbi:MAG: hypothetical protein H0U92_05800 [Actinobacteria bacterium]|nr:hypothetical protein [Actinomycetota bacterium]
MRDFEFGRTFDVVTCLFSSVGYMLTIDDLNQAVGNMVRHLSPGGVLVVEPWLHPDAWRIPHVTAEAAQRPGMAVARASTTGRQGHVSSFTLHWTIATFEGVEHIVEDHELGLYEVDEYRDVFVAAGMSVEHDPVGLIGRGLFVGVKHT